MPQRETPHFALSVSSFPIYTDNNKEDHATDPLQPTKTDDVVSWTTSLGAEREIKKDTVLPNDFVVSALSVKCGRGKDTYNHSGNCHFRSVINQSRERYLKAPTRSQKSVIVIDIVHTIRKRYRTQEKRPDSVGAFVKYNKKLGRWVDIGDINAREKVGHALRGKVNAPGSENTAKETKDNISLSSDFLQKRQRALLAEMMMKPTKTTSTLTSTPPTITAEKNNDEDVIPATIPSSLTAQISISMAPSLDPTWSLDDDKILADLDLGDLGCTTTSSSSIMNNDEEFFVSLLPPITVTSV